MDIEFLCAGARGRLFPVSADSHDGFEVMHRFTIEPPQETRQRV